MISLTRFNLAKVGVNHLIKSGCAIASSFVSIDLVNDSPVIAVKIEPQWDRAGFGECDDESGRCQQRQVVTRQPLSIELMVDYRQTGLAFN